MDFLRCDKIRNGHLNTGKQAASLCCNAELKQVWKLFQWHKHEGNWQ